MDQAGKAPQLVTYHAGGNNCDFGAVVTKCVFQPEPLTDWGPEYPDPSGACAQAFNTASHYIDNQERAALQGLYIDEFNTVVDILSHPEVKGNDGFNLYILSYAQFFHVSEDNWCDNATSSESFAVPNIWRKKPKLSVQLRTDLNDAVVRVNKVLQRVVTDVADSRVKYVDIDAAFEGHRFCEDKHSSDDQYINPDVWLWNRNFPSQDPKAVGSVNVTALHAFLANGEIAGSQSYVGGPGLGYEMQGDANAASGSDGGIGGQVWTQRPFHPKVGGTQAIADIIIAQAKKDKIPGVVGSPTPSSGTCNCDENGCSPESPPCCASGTC
jgi:hypothetical protein